MKPFKLFIPITKVDAVKRLVYGAIAIEEQDKTGETFDYDTSKPLFQAWSADTLARSQGKSYGNVRAMHGKIAAGLLPEPIVFDDEGKRVEAVAKIVDDAEWEKVTEGVYTGFSIGGEYIKKWNDGEGGMRYTAAPFEVSIVDNPAMPGTHFAMVKSDGVEERAFSHYIEAEKDPLVTITNEMVLARANTLAKAAGSEKPMDFIAPARTELEDEKAAAPAKAAGEATGTADPQASADPAGTTAQAAGEGDGAAVVTKAAEPAPGAPPGAADLVQVWQARDGRAYAKKADAIAHNLTLDDPDSAEALAALARAAMEKAEGKKGDGKTKKTDAADATGKAGEAKAKDDPDADDDDDATDPKTDPKGNGKGKPAATAKGKKATRKKAADTAGDTGGAAKAVTIGGLQKGMHDIARLAHLIGELDWLQDGLEQEAGWEGDASAVPASLKEDIAGLVGTLKELVEEETSELFTDDESEAFSDLMELAAGGLTASQFGLVEKVATGKLAASLAKAKLSRGQADKVQNMHDHATAMGASCPGAGGDEAAKALGLEKKLNKDEMDRAQAIHDDCSAMGASCAGAGDSQGVSKAAGGDAGLNKLVADNTLLKSVVKDLTTRLDALEKAPFPQQPVRLHVVGKGDDDPVANEQSARAAAEFLKGAPQEVLAAAAFKMIHATGGRPMQFGNMPKEGT